MFKNPENAGMVRKISFQMKSYLFNLHEMFKNLGSGQTLARNGLLGVIRWQRHVAFPSKIFLFSLCSILSTNSPTTCKNMSLSSCLFLRMSQSSIKLSIPLSVYIEICIDISIHQPFLFSIHISRELTLSQGTDLRTGNSAPSMSRLSETSCPQSTVINGL